MAFVTVHRISSALLAAILVLAARPARATDPFEIQVYEPDMDDPGQLSLEVHTNYTIAGQKTGDTPDQVAPNHVGRMTLEPAIGVTRWLELGAYLQGFLEAGGTPHFGGVKVRAKFVPLRPQGSPWFYGINVEIGRVPVTVDADGWANELRPLLGFDDGYWLFDVNPIVGYALTGGNRFKPDLEPCGKVAYNPQIGARFGLEYYSGLGLLTDGLSPLRQQEHMIYAVVDRANAVGDDTPGWEVNFGVGRSITDASPSNWSVKAIIGRAF